MSEPERPKPMAWAQDDAERDTIENRLNRLVGRRIERVRYVELGGYEGPNEPLWRGPGFDALDYGFELDLDDAATWSCIWKMLGFNSGLLVYPGTLVPSELTADAGIAVWDVGDHWRARGPSEITKVTSVWAREFFVGFGTSSEPRSIAPYDAMCLTTVVLLGRDGREAIITLGERSSTDGPYCPHPQNVAVFFSAIGARAAGVLMPGDGEAVMS